MQNPVIGFFDKKKNVYLLVFLLMLVDRITILLDFGFAYTGNDDIIFWQAANDYSKGIFHEPYFYGQNYNFMLEALLAVPLIWIQIPFYIALPLTTTIVSLFPFVMFSIVLFKKGFTAESLLFLLIPLLLPVEYGILCSMTRGFVNGIFFSGFFVFPLLSPLKKSSWIIYSVSAAAGFICNPNSIIIALPVGFYLWLNNYKKLMWYMITFASVVPFLCIEYFAKRFYIIHPQYLIHGAWPLDFSFDRIFANFQILDDFFTYSTPVFWVAGWIILPLLFCAGIMLWKKDKIKSMSILIAVLFIVISLGVNKVNDTTHNLFLSSARMYLAIPVVTGIVFWWIKEITPLTERHLKFLALAIGISVFCIKIGIEKTIVNYHTTRGNFGRVAVRKIDDLKCDCDLIHKEAKKINAELIIYTLTSFMGTADIEFFNNACPLLVEGFPQTLFLQYEHRTWVYIEELKKRRRNILVIGKDEVKGAEKLKGGKIFSPYVPVVEFKNNTLRTDSLMMQMGHNVLR